MEEEFGLKKHRTLISQQVRTSVIKYIIYVYIIYYLLYIYCIYICYTKKIGKRRKQVFTSGGEFKRWCNGNFSGRNIDRSLILRW